MADQDADLSEDATPYKLEKARQQGSVVKSADLNAAVILLVMVGAMYAIGWSQVKESVRLQQSILSNVARVEWSPDGMAAWMGEMVMGALHVLAPLFAATSIAAILVNLFQTGPIFSMKPLSPDIERINPATGFKRLFSMRTLYEAAKSIFKLMIIGGVAGIAITDAIPGLIALSAMEPRNYARALVEITAGLLIKLAFALLILAVIDLAYTRWEYAKRMRMSRRDVRDESKQREGDPRIRARIRELRKEMLKRSRAVRNVSSADVLITNPTRIAVALSYRHGEGSAPKLVAKGAGELARKMRAIANRHSIPVVQNRMLARALFREVDYDGYIPQKLYPQIAKIMVWVHLMREMKQPRGDFA